MKETLDKNFCKENKEKFLIEFIVETFRNLEDFLKRNSYGFLFQLMEKFESVRLIKFLDRNLIQFFK